MLPPPSSLIQAGLKQSSLTSLSNSVAQDTADSHLASRIFRRSGHYHSRESLLGLEDKIYSQIATSQEILLSLRQERLSGRSAPERVLFVPASGCIDYSLNAKTLDALIFHRQDQILEVLKSWGKSSKTQTQSIQSLDELLAYSLKVAQKDGQKKQRVRVNAEVRAALKQEILQLGFPEPRGAPGGATFFAATIAAAAGHKVSLLSPSAEIPEVLGKALASSDYTDGMTFVTRTGKVSLAEMQQINSGTGEHFNLRASRNSVSIPLKLHSFCGEQFGGLELLVTGTTYQRGFQGFEPSSLKGALSNYNSAFISGLQYIENAEHREQFIDEVESIGRAGIMSVAVYSEPKVNTLQEEPETLLRLARTGCIDQLSLNTSEACELVNRICHDPNWSEQIARQQGRLGKRKIATAKNCLSRAKEAFRRYPNDYSKFEEHPRSVYAFARILQSILSEPIRGGITMVRVRSRHCESIVLSPELTSNINPNETEGALRKIRLILMGARGLSYSKAVVPHGWIQKSSELKVYNSPVCDDKIVAALLCSEFAQNQSSTRATHSLNFDSPFIHKVSGQACMFVIPPEIENAPGGTVSLGDANDALSFSALSELKGLFAAFRYEAAPHPIALRYKERFLDT